MIEDDTEDNPPIEYEDPSQLTNRQREFAKLYAEGIYSNAACARKAGYSEKNARVYASKLLDGRHFPLVPQYIAELREENERRYGVSLLGQLRRLDQLSRSAEEAGQYSAAINAEKIRSALGGLTIDRREQQHFHQYDKLTREEIVQRLEKLREKFPTLTDAEYEVIDGGSRTGSMGETKAIASGRGSPHED